MFFLFFFFFNDTATTEIYTLSLHDALPISCPGSRGVLDRASARRRGHDDLRCCAERSEEHTSELQSRLHLVCRLLLEKKKKNCYRPVSSAPLLPVHLSRCSLAAPTNVSCSI